MSASLPANDAAFSPTPVRVLTMNAGAEQVIRDGEEHKPDELWSGTAYGADGVDVPIIMRVALTMPTVAELCCAVIGRALSLPMPEPFLVRIDATKLPKSRFVNGRNAERWCFASNNLGGQPFLQLLNANSEYARAMLERWPHLVHVAAFDEWLANPDRNLGNIIFCANVLYLIDHAEAFGGSLRARYPLRDLAHEAFANKLADIVFPALAEAQRAAATSVSGAWLAGASVIAFDDALTAAGIDRLVAAGLRDELLDFIATRLQIAHTLLCARLGFPQLPLHQAAKEPSALLASGSSSISAPA